MKTVDDIYRFAVEQAAIARGEFLELLVRQERTVSVRYAVRDPLVGDLLDVARRIFDNHLVGTQDLLKKLKREQRAR